MGGFCLKNEVCIAAGYLGLVSNTKKSKLYLN